MTTNRQLVIDGMREAAIIGVGVTPEAEEFDEGLRQLQNVVLSLFGNEMGDPLTDVNYGGGGTLNANGKADDQSSIIASNYVPENTRLILNLTKASTVYLHPNPRDGARFAFLDNIGNLNTYNFTVRSNGRKFLGGVTGMTFSVPTTWNEFFYRSDLGDWRLVPNSFNPIQANDDSLFPLEFDMFLTMLLAFRLNPRYGATTSEEMTLAFQRSRRQFRSRYRQSNEQASEDGWTRISSNRNRYSTDSTRFNLGRP